MPGDRHAGLEERRADAQWLKRPCTAACRTAAVTVRDLQPAKEAGERWPMLTAYDYSRPRVFDEAGIPVLLVGDSAANVVLRLRHDGAGTVDELLPLVRGVVRGTKRALVVADLPFGSVPGLARRRHSRPRCGS